MKTPVKHYENMIEWAEKQVPEKNASKWVMYSAIEENWDSKDCQHCKKYYEPKNEYKDRCQQCPLYKIEECCRFNNSQWKKMNNCSSWKTWLVEARKMLELLKKIEGENKITLKRSK